MKQYKPATLEKCPKCKVVYLSKATQQVHDEWHLSNLKPSDEEAYMAMNPGRYDND